MRVGCLSTFLVAVMALSATAGNLVVDTEFSPDGLGGLLNWEYRNELPERQIVRMPKAGPDRSSAVLLRDFHANVSFGQGNYALVAGEPYRISVWTRTKDLPADGVRWVLWGQGWKGKDCSVFFPTNTHGKWVRLEATCSALPVVTCSLGAHFKANMPSGATLELARPVLEPLSEKGQKESKSPVADVRHERFRIVPVAPKLSEVDPDSGEMTFYYGGDLPGEFGGFELRAAVDGILRGSALQDDTRRVTIRMGRILPGDHSLALNLIWRKTNRRIARDVYQIRVRKPEVFDVGKPLNNLVTELVSAKAAAGDFPFVNPRDGWVFMGLSDSDEAAEGFLDGDATPVIRKREGEPLQTMRYLLAGRHVLTLRGVKGGTLAVRAVKALVCRTPDRHGTDIRTHRYGESFCRRFVFPWSNVVGGWQNYGTSNRFDRTEDEVARPYAERGMRVAGRASLVSCTPLRSDINEILAAIRKDRAGWVSGQDIFFDENRMLGPHNHHENFAEALWRSFAAGQAFYVYYGDGANYPFIEPRVHANEISAIVNSGTGRGCLALEAYPHGFADEKRAYAQFDGYLDFAKSSEKVVPAARGCVDYNMAYWMCPHHGYNTWTSSAADLRVLTDRMFHRIAVDPAFKDTAWGVGFGAFYTTDEEMVRWMMRLVRHYAIEGRTDSVSESLGYRYNPGYIRNGDFVSDLDGWTVEAAAPDSLKRIVIDGYGRKGQGRRAEPGDPVGDALALFVRQPARANRLSQRISGLVPGKRYSLVCISQDYDQYLKTPGSQGTNYAFRVDFDGATNEPALEACDVGENKAACHICRHRLVFRAQSPDVTVTFLDRAPGEPENVSTRIGQRRMVNFLHVHDYFEGDRPDVDDMLELK